MSNINTPFLKSLIATLVALEGFQNQYEELKAYISGNRLSAKEDPMGNLHETLGRLGELNAGLESIQNQAGQVDAYCKSLRSLIAHVTQELYANNEALAITSYAGAKGISMDEAKAVFAANKEEALSLCQSFEKAA